MDMDGLLGFGFKPTKEEIIRLLEMKRLDPDFSVQTIKEIDFYGFDPWELPRIQSKEQIWYFYCRPCYFKNSKRNRSRRTNSGYWKITSKVFKMKAKNIEAVIGSKKILSFYLRSNSKKAKIEWVVHEIQVKDDPLYKEDFVVCCLKRKQNNKLDISTSGDGESSQHLVVAENTSPNSVLPPSQQLVSDRNHEVAGNPFLLLSPNSKLQLLSNQHSNGYNALDNDSFSELQSPIYPDPGSSYTNSPTNGCDLMNSHCDREQIDNRIHSQRAFQNVYSLEETRQTLNPEFNPSKLDGGVHGEDVSEMNTENFIAWVNEQLKD